MNFNTIYLLLCIVISGRGDDHWKKRTRDKRHQDIREIEEYIGMDRDSLSYEEYFDAATENDFDSNAHLDFSKHRKRNRAMLLRRKQDKSNPTFKKTFENSMEKIDNHLKNMSEDISNDLRNFKNIINDRKNYKKSLPKWPKFEDLLVSLGIEYDWKSDRWIKIKEKPNKSLNASIQKHEFKYRTIRIKGSKRRNIIVAVTAVR